MLVKIVNWTAGSFFRTIGRLLVFVLIGIIISRLVDFGSLIDSFSITDLFFEKVSAATLVENVKQVGNGYLSITNASQFTDTNTFYIKSIYSSTTTNDVRNFEYTFADNIRPTKTNGDYIGFQIIMSKPKDTTTVNTYTYDTCYRFMPVQCGEDAFGNYSCGYQCYQWTSSHDGGTETVIQSTQFDNLNFSVRISYANGGWSMCEIQGNQVYCPLNNSGATAIRVIYDFVAEATTNMNIGLSRGYLLYKSSDVASAVESQTQQQQQQHNETMQQSQQQHNEVMDDNTTEAESEASSFFEDFSQTDHGGLSSILTAPLTIFNKILDDTCVPATFTYRGKTVSLPCGQEFWNQAPNLRDWLSMIESGIIAYAILISLFKLIQKLESPSNSEVEVESL